MAEIRNNWTKEEIQTIYDMPMMDLVFKAAEVHRAHHNPQEVQVCTLLSVKTGGCPEDCAYCPQAARYHTDVKVHKPEHLQGNKHTHAFLLPTEVGIIQVLLECVFK